MKKLDAEMIAVFGMRGSGKTTRVKELLEGRRRIVVFDPHHEYPFPKVDNFPALLAHIKSHWRDFAVSYVPPENSEQQALSDLSEVLFKVMQPYKDGSDDQQMTLVVEELQMSFPSESLPAGCRGFLAMCQRGRHWGINVIGVTQQPASISARFKGNCAEHHLFNLEWHTDLKAVGAMIGPDKVKKIQLCGPHQSYIYRNRSFDFRANKVWIGDIKNKSKNMN